MQTITVTNQKGGIGKSTTAHAIAALFAESGARVLAVDVDPQGNLTAAAGGNRNAPGSFEVLTQAAPAADIIQHLPGGLDLLGGGDRLSRAGAVLTDIGKEYRLKEALDSVSGLYDFCVIDTPPALGILTVSALTAANKLVIPAQADYFSLDAIRALRDAIEVVKKYTNPGLIVDGILITRWPPAMRCLSRDIAEAMTETAATMGTRVYNARIRESIVVQEAQAQKANLFSYAGRSKPAEDYRRFFSELNGREETETNKNGRARK